MLWSKNHFLYFKNNVRRLGYFSDYITRGKLPSELVISEVGFHITQFLSESLIDKPSNEWFVGKDIQEIALKEEKKTVIHSSELNDDH